MKAETRARLLSGLRRGAAAGALSGGLLMVGVAFLWAIQLAMGVRGVSATVLVGLPAQRARGADPTPLPGSYAERRPVIKP
jgi:hypothetical protein